MRTQIADLLEFEWTSGLIRMFEYLEDGQRHMVATGVIVPITPTSVKLISWRGKVSRKLMSQFVQQLVAVGIVEIFAERNGKSLPGGILVEEGPLKGWICTSLNTLSSKL